MLQPENMNFVLDLCFSHHKAIIDYSRGFVNLFYNAKGPCNGVEGGKSNIIFILHSYIKESWYNYLLELHIGDEYDTAGSMIY